MLYASLVRQPPLVLAVEAGFDFSSPEYGALFARSDADAFRHPVWMRHFFQTLVPARGAVACSLVGRDDDGRLVFVLPLILRRMKGVRLLETADLGVGDYAAPVVARDALGRLAGIPDLKAEVRAALPGHDILRLRPVRPEQVDVWRLFFDAADRPLDFAAHATELSAPYAEWRKRAFGKSFTRYLDRRRKRWQAAGTLRLDRLAGEEAAGAIAEIRRLRRGRFGGDPIQTQAVEAFYAGVAREGTGLVHLYRLSDDGIPAAYAFCIAHAGRLLYLLIGCDYDRVSRHSPGLVLYDMMMEDWSGEPHAVFDFTIGDEPFKRDFATVPTPMHMLVATPTMLGKAARLAFDARAQAARLRRRGGDPTASSSPAGTDDT